MFHHCEPTDFMQLPQNQQVSPTVQLPGAKTQGSWGNDPCKTLHNYIHPILISFPSSHSSGVFPMSNSARWDLSTKLRFSFERLSVKNSVKTCCIFYRLMARVIPVIRTNKSPHLWNV